METNVLLLFLLAGVTLSAYVTAINSKGTVRIVLSYILASLVLLITVFCIMKHSSSQELAEKEAEKVRQKAQYEEQLRQAELQRQAEENARLAAESNQAASGIEAQKQYKDALLSIVNSGAGVARAILGVDVENENADMDALLSKSNSLKIQANSLKTKLSDLTAPEGTQTLDEGRKNAEKGLQLLAASANAFNLFFKAEDENEEDERFDLYRQNAKAASGALSKAAGLIEKVQ